MEKKRIMIVNDEEDFLKIIRLNLETTGKYDIITLVGAKDIISKVHKFKPDIILLDIIMPKIDGVEVCERLNKDSEAAKIPVISLSALDTDKDKLMMYKLGVVDFLIKPIEKNELIAKIEKALRFK